MQDFLMNLLPKLEHLNYIWYIIVFWSSLLESIIIAWYIVPGSTIIILFWMLAWWWYYDLWDVLFFAILWNVLWTLISFYIWKRVWKKVFKKGFLFIKSEHFENAALFFKEHWWKSVFLWKLIPWVKETIPFIAWVLEMNIWKYLFRNILWAIAWGIVFVWIWYIFSSSLLIAEIWITRFWYFILLVVSIFLIFALIKFLITKYLKLFVSLNLELFNFLKKKLLSNSHIRTFVEKHTNIIQFLINRVKNDNFLGLPFTILAIIILYLTNAYIWLTDTVLDWEIITQVDIRLSNFFYYINDFKINKIFLFISYLWNNIIVLLVTFITSVILFLRWKKYEILWLFASVSISTIIAVLSKAIIARPRPKLAIYLENWYSFPSFHAVISVALYWFIIRLFLAQIKKWQTKINIIFGWIIIAFFIWLSRLYLNVHYLSDVISGWFLWFLWLTFWITIIWYLKHRTKQKKEIYFKKYNKIIISCITLFWMIFSVFYYKTYYNDIIFLKNSEINYTQINNLKDFLDTKPHLKYTETITWRETEPINFVFIVQNENELLKSFKKSWWEEADKLWRNSLMKTWKAIIKNTQYDTAPITPLYWNRKIQTLWFQKLTKEANIRYRHHIRIWKSDYKIWENYIYFGCWVYDNWLKRGIITHKIDPDLDKERDYTFNDLVSTRFINKFELITLENTFKWTNFSWDEFFTDGKAYVLDFK